MMQVISYVTYGLLTLAVVAFLLLAWRDLLMLVRKPPGMSRGIWRVWALARIALAEAFSAKAWVVLIAWFVACFIINLLVRPHGDDQRERMSVYLMVLMRGQEYLVLLMVGVLACFSLPKERERRTIVTTGAKPISRLELYLGKVVGFSTLAAMMLLAMGVVSYVYLWAYDEVGKRQTFAVYQLKKTDYERGLPGAGPPPEGLKLDADRGVLQANNFVTAAGGVQIAGQILYTDKETRRFLKGGSEERMIYLFPHVLEVLGTPNDRAPVFVFTFAAWPATANVHLPQTILLDVTLYSEKNRSTSGTKEHTLKMQANSQRPGFYETAWEPALDVRAGVMTVMGDRDYGRVGMEVKCSTPGVYLQVNENRSDTDSNVLVYQSADLQPGQALLPLFPPRILGFEKNGTQQVEGPKSAERAPRALESFTSEQLLQYCQDLEVASWRFKANDIAAHVKPDKNGNFTLSMYLEVDKQKNHEWPTEAAVIAYTPLTQRTPELRAVNVAEKRLTEITLPVSLLAVDSDLFVDLRCLMPGHWIGGNNLSVRVQLAETPFIWNLIKSEIVIFAEVVLLVIIAVAASLRLGGWVAMLVTAVAYLLGNMVPTIEATVLQGASSIFNPAEQQQMAGSPIFQFFIGVYGVLLKIVYVVVKALPDFRVFDPLGFILDWRNMPLTALGLTLFWTALYALPFVALAYLLVRKQELA